MPRSSAILVAIALVSLAHGRARAAPELELSWSSPEGCPDATWAAARVHEHLGREPLQDAEHALAVSAELAREGDGFRITLHTVQEGASGDRTIRAATCDELAEAAALVIALAIDPDAVAQRSAQAEAADDTNEPSADVPAPTEVDGELPPGLVKIAPKPPRERPWTLRAGALWDIGYQPEWGIAPAIAVGYEWRRLRAELSGFWFAPRASEPSASGGRVRVSLWAVRAGACGRVIERRARSEAGRVSLWLCGGFEVGRTGGVGRGLPQGEQDHFLWRALGAGTLLVMPISRAFRVAAELGAAVPLNRPRFVAENPDQTGLTVLYEPAPLSGRATLGFELRI